MTTSRSALIISTIALILVAVLVVPGSASEVVVNVDCHSLDGWTDSLESFAAGSSGIYRTSVTMSSRSISYDLPYSVPPDKDFSMTFTVHANTDSGIGTSNFYVGLRGPSSGVGLCSVHFSSLNGEIGTQLTFETAYSSTAAIRYRIPRTDPEFADALTASPIRVGYYRIGTVYYCYVNGELVHTFNSVNDTYQAPSFNRLVIGSPINYGVDRVHFSVEDISVSRDVVLPEPPDNITPVLRTGSVTMTDHNGTTITGFEATAVNYYTDESYTVSTDTDVAVMSLPMDRMTEIRNPQTGVYEEAPVGYYLFYGQAPGYKMLAEDGIRVMVMPEKYGSYKFCDILVSSDSGPLTGKHQFQIRSRSDYSVLQTGTISAKSATTGICYNTTVTDGIATLILPYDTSDALSEYAGHYYVYATSPGYEDSDYGTQIIVSPRTVSEVKTILLTPIGGVPTPGNVTLRIQAISETGSGVPNTEIFIAGVIGDGKSVWDTYTASSSGYLAVSVPRNSTYDIIASAVGYYDSSRRVQVFIDDPPLIEIRLYLSGAPTLEPTVEPTGWPTGPPTTQPTSGIPDEDDGSGGFLMQAVRGIGNAFGVGFSTAKIIFGMLLALSIGFATAKQLRGGAAEFGLGLLGGTMLGVLVGLIPVWTIVVLLLVVGLYIGHRYVGGGANNG